jgi:hypothetical protein
MLGDERHGIGVGNAPAVLPDEPHPVRRAGNVLTRGSVQTEITDHRVAPDAVGLNAILDGLPLGIVDRHSPFSLKRSPLRLSLAILLVYGA